MESASIIDFQPKPIKARDGEMKGVEVTISTFLDHNNARIKFFNRKPKAVDLFDNNETADTIYSDPFDLVVGKAIHEHDIGFKLQGIWKDGGAVVTIDVTIIDANNSPISSTAEIEVSVRAY